MIARPSGRDHGPQNQLFLTLEPPNYFKECKKNPESFFQNIVTGNLNISEIEHFEKTGAEHPEDPSNTLLTILNMGSISSRKHEMGMIL